MTESIEQIITTNPEAALELLQDAPVVTPEIAAEITHAQEAIDASPSSKVETESHGLDQTAIDMLNDKIRLAKAKDLKDAQLFVDGLLLPLSRRIVQQGETFTLDGNEVNADDVKQLREYANLGIGAFNVSNIEERNAYRAATKMTQFSELSNAHQNEAYELRTEAEMNEDPAITLDRFQEATKHRLTLSAQVYKQLNTEEKAAETQTKKSKGSKPVITETIATTEPTLEKSAGAKKAKFTTEAKPAAETEEKTIPTQTARRTRAASHLRDSIKDLVQLDSTGRAHYESGVDAKGKKLAGRFMTKHELDILQDQQELIRGGAAAYAAEIANETALVADQEAQEFFAVYGMSPAEFDALPLTDQKDVIAGRSRGHQTEVAPVASTEALKPVVAAPNTATTEQTATAEIETTGSTEEVQAATAGSESNEPATAQAPENYTLTQKLFAKWQARAMTRTPEQQKRRGRFLKVASVVGGLAVLTYLQYRFNLFHDGGSNAAQNLASNSGSGAGGSGHQIVAGGSQSAPAPGQPSLFERAGGNGDTTTTTPGLTPKTGVGGHPVHTVVPHPLATPKAENLHFDLAAGTPWQSMHEAGIPDSQIMARLHEAANASGLHHEWFGSGTDEWLELTTKSGQKVSDTAGVMKLLGQYITK